MKQQIIKSFPIFMPAKPGSNCSDVKSIIEKLKDTEVDNILGIIDWDDTNNSSERLIVNGENDRYTIENYILDPLVIGMFGLWKSHFKFDDFDELSIKRKRDLHNINIDDAQSIINKISTDLDFVPDKTFQYILQNGWSLKITDSLLRIKGHELEKIVINTNF